MNNNLNVSICTHRGGIGPIIQWYLPRRRMVVYIVCNIANGEQHLMKVNFDFTECTYRMAANILQCLLIQEVENVMSQK